MKHGISLAKPLLGLHEITLFHTTFEGFTAETLRGTYGFDLPGLRFETLEHTESLGRISQEADVFLAIGGASPCPARARINLWLVFFPLPLDDDPSTSRPLAVRLGHTEQRFRTSLLALVDQLCPSLQQHSIHEFRRRVGSLGTALRLPLFALRKVAWAGGRHYRYRLGYPALNNYHYLLANSKYAAGWIKRTYGKQSEISYPPIDVDRFVPSAKQRVMLSVGCFDVGPMSKRHDALIAVFRQLHGEGVLKDWRMVICGGSDGSSAFESNIASLRQAAAGLPISIEVNAPFSRIRELYGASSVYLHAMGLDRDPNFSPWAFEHFGMTTVEAMAAEAVPIVFAGGGQTEIVTDSENGFLWRSREELKVKIREFIDLNASKKSVLQERARRRAMDFGEEAFYARTCDLYRRLGIDVVEAPAKSKATLPDLV